MLLKINQDKTINTVDKSMKLYASYKSIDIVLSIRLLVSVSLLLVYFRDEIKYIQKRLVQKSIMIMVSNSSFEKKKKIVLGTTN